MTKPGVKSQSSDEQRKMRLFWRTLMASFLILGIVIIIYSYVMAPAATTVCVDLHTNRTVLCPVGLGGMPHLNATVLANGTLWRVS